MAPRATAMTDNWSGYPGAPTSTTIRTSIGPMAAHIILPWPHPRLRQL
ncbi:MAG: hypothetical protein HWD60_14620 [Defluviicoccus sp.]|nr:MAG: hypothetical protein HWD60_14620 [Defluviicoccus sp.]